MGSKNGLLPSSHCEPPPLPPPVVRSVKASEVVMRNIEWLRANRWPAGFVGYVDGETGVGKSTVLSAEIADLTTGEQAYNVGIVNLEDPIDQVIVPRLKAAGADLERVRIYEAGELAWELKHLQLPKDIDSISQWAVQHDLRFIVIDPGVSYLQKGIKWKDEQDMRQVMDPLAVLARKLNGFIGFVRHWTKGTAPKALTQGSGANTIANAARIGYACYGDPNDPALRYFVQVKCNLCPPQKARSYRIEGVLIEELDTQGNPHQISTTRIH